MSRTLTSVERAALLAGLDANLRVDGRNLTQFREMHLQLDSHRRGSVTAFVMDGQESTKVKSMVTANLVRPFEDRSAEGMVSFYVEATSAHIKDDWAQSSHFGDIQFDNGDRSGGAVGAGRLQSTWDVNRIQRLVDRVYKDAKVLDLSSLVIVPGEAVWNLRVDVHILSANAGSVLDVLSAAIVASLYDMALPKISQSEISTTTSFLVPRANSCPIQMLTLRNPAIMVSSTIVDVQSALHTDHASKHVGDRRVVLADTTVLEEGLMSMAAGGASHVVVAMNSMGEVALVLKSAGEPVSSNVVLEQSVAIAAARSKHLFTLVSSSLK